MLQAGDPIPEFALASTQGGEVSSMSLRGKRYVLYFYPKDDTPGCTVEACNFRDTLPQFSDIGAPVYGVSPDDISAHQKFIAKHALNFPLLADPDRKLIEAVGVWVEKSMYGKKYMGVQRSTFVIGPDGRIEKVWPKVTPDGHAQEVLEYLTSTPSNGGAPPEGIIAAPSPATGTAAQNTPVVKVESKKKPAGVKPTGQRPNQPAKKRAVKRSSKK
jgi:peroxiredoxin Q/BCP